MKGFVSIICLFEIVQHTAFCIYIYILTTVKEYTRSHLVHDIYR